MVDATLADNAKNQKTDNNIAILTLRREKNVSSDGSSARCRDGDEVADDGGGTKNANAAVFYSLPRT